MRAILATAPRCPSLANSTSNVRAICFRSRCVCSDTTIPGRVAGLRANLVTTLLFMKIAGLHIDSRTAQQRFFFLFPLKNNKLQQAKCYDKILFTVLVLEPCTISASSKDRSCPNYWQKKARALWTSSSFSPTVPSCICISSLSLLGVLCYVIRNPRVHANNTQHCHEQVMVMKQRNKQTNK